VLMSMKARGIIRHADEWVPFFTDAGFKVPEQIIIDDPLGIFVATKS